MYSILLMAALTGSAEAPACQPACWTPCYPVYYYCSPPIYYVYPCIVLPDASQGDGTAEDGDEDASTSADKLTPQEEAEWQKYSKDLTAAEKTEISTVEAKRIYIKAMREAEQKSEKKGKGDKDDDGKDDQDEQSAAPLRSATIVVKLPADARLFVDEEATTSTSSNRRLISPPLEQGKEYYYTLRAEMARAGKVVVQSQRVTIRAGQESKIQFADDAADVVQK